MSGKKRTNTNAGNKETNCNTYTKATGFRCGIRGNRGPVSNHLLDTEKEEEVTRKGK